MDPWELSAGYALDWCIGDPEGMPHPVRAIGWMVNASERALRRCGSGKGFELAAGAVVACGIPVAAALSIFFLLKQAGRVHPTLARVEGVWLAAACLATRGLLDESAEVMSALENGDMARARLRLARIVGRDTCGLDETEVSRAVIETLAESLSDGIVAPLFYLVLGGVPLAIAYKAVNTLDSMIGHKDEAYLHFGRAAARLDDVANYIPARVSALLLCLAARFVPGTDGLRGAATWLRDGSKHASPNAGQVEAAMAGLLGVRLGGTNRYGGEVAKAAHLGEEFPAATCKAARRAWKAVAAASLLGFGGALFLTLRRRNG